MCAIDAGVRINTVLIPAKLTGTGTIFSSPHDCLGMSSLPAWLSTHMTTINPSQAL